MRRALVLLLSLALVAAACSDSGEDSAGSGILDALQGAGTTPSAEDASDDDAEVRTDALDWTQIGGGIEEAYVEVPLDHDDPDGETIEIAIARRRADDPDRRIGPLLINPGGPGASGIEYASYAELLFDDEILDRFDIIGFDPRGVEASSPVVCGDDDFLDEYTAVDPVPDSPEETAAATGLVEEFAAGCQEQSGDILPDLDTVSTAKDMDLIREALGEEQITYLGFSYGTFLGATYLELFGDRARAAVLDGAYSRSLSPEELTLEQAVGFEGTLDAWLEHCRAVDCDFARGADPETALFALFDSIDARPLATDDDDGRDLTVGLAWTALLQALYSDALWPLLDSALLDAVQKDGSGLLQLADQYNDRNLVGDYANQSYAFPTISCNDSAPLDWSDEEEQAAKDRIIEAAPRIGPAFVTLPGPCDYWPFEPDPPTGPFSAPDAPPTLVVATTGDPATPYEWGVTLADELETSTLLTVEGDSHTAYFEGNRCVDDIVDRYILTLELPADGARC